jgi:transposase
VSRAAEQDRPDVAEARRVFHAAQPLLEPGRLVFLDETATATNMTRRYGRCATGQRLVDKVPFGHWKVTTVVAALRAGGVEAVMAVDGALNGDLFVAYVEQCLVPTLQAGDVVILDNLSSHKRAEAREMIERAGASLIFLPAYSPDLNPNEMAFSKLKAKLRKAKERTVEGLRAATFAALAAFPPGECANFLRAAGYGATPTPIPL